MTFFKSLPDDAGPPNVFTKYPEIYGPWSTMSQALMNGPSPLSQGERELILAYAAGVAGCKFVYVAHSEVAYAWGVEPGVMDRLLEDLDSAPVEARLKPLLAFVRKLTLTPGEMSQTDADAVFEAGWEEQALLTPSRWPPVRFSCSGSSKGMASRRSRARSPPSMPNDGLSAATSTSIGRSGTTSSGATGWRSASHQRHPAHHR